MLKKITTREGSPVITAKAQWYVVARDEDKYSRWILGISNKLKDFVEIAKAESEKKKGEEKATDIFCGSCPIDKKDMTFSSKVPSREKAGEYFDAPYRLGFYSGIEYFIGTRSGRPLTKEERKRYVKDLETVFCHAASALGAIYMETEIDGKKAIWHDDESCYEACELPPDQLVKPNMMEEIQHKLKKEGIDLGDFEDELGDFVKELEEAELTDEMDDELEKEMIGFLKGLNGLLEEVKKM